MKTLLFVLLALGISFLNTPSILAECHPGHSGGIPIGGGGGGGGSNENHSHGPGGEDMGGGNSNVPGPDFVGPRLPEQEMGQPGGGSGQNVDPGPNEEMVSGGGVSMKGDGGNDAQTVQSQIAADAAKQEQERWKNLQNTQTNVFEIEQEVTTKKAQNADKSSKAWDEFVNN